MIEFGKTLRTAREARGYTIAQIAEMTRMLAAIVEDLENENFSHIAAPKYGRGFVKLYCEAVGLDPKPLIEEYMDIYNGNRDTGIRERPVVAPPAAAAEEPPQVQSIPEPPAEPSAPAEEKPEYRLEQEVVHIDPIPEPEAPVPPAATEDPIMPDNANEAPFSRYGTPFHEGKERRMPSFAPSLWRMGALVAALALLVFLLFIGIRGLYRATAVQTDTDTKTVETPVTAPVKDRAQDKKPAAPREKVDIPQLYVD